MRISLLPAKEIVCRPAFILPAVFVVVAAAFAYLQATPAFADPDSYYHAKMVALILAHGPVRNFPWLPLTELSAIFVDHHFLYHLLVLPFAAVGGPLVGLKVAAVLGGALAVTALAWTIQRFAGAAAGWLSLLVLTSGTLVFRLGDPKAGALSLALALVIFGLTRQSRAWPYLLLGWLYVWLYGGWPLGLLLLLMNSAAAAFLARRGPPAAAKAFAVALKQLLALLVGNVAGIVANPYFPANLRFYWEQIVQVAVIGYGTEVNIGIEWYPYPFRDLVTESPFILLLLGALLVMMAYVAAARLQKPEVRPRDAQPLLAAGMAAALLLAMTLRSRRHVEYFLPFAILLLAALAAALVRRLDWPRLRADFRALFRRPEIFLVGAVFYFAFMFAWFSLTGLRAAASFYREPRSQWAAAARLGQAVADNVPAGGLVFHDDWSDFPQLFYFADGQRYVAGVDPTFFYRQDPALYDRWRELVTGRFAGDAVAAIRDQFHAQAVLVRAANRPWLDQLERDQRLRRVFDDGRYRLYLLP